MKRDPERDTGDVAAHYDAVAADYHKQYQRDQLDDSAEYPANYERLQIIVQRMARTGVRRIYEVGTGEGTPLVTLARMGYEAWGCDISEQMVARTREHFAKAGLVPERVQWGDIQDSMTVSNQLKDGLFDALMALGVMPHVRDERLTLANMRMMVRTGGRVFIEFRNKLFSLFTFNRYTKEFILDDLLAGVKDDVKRAVASELDRRVAVDLPPVRTTTASGGIGYDAILSRFHNPFDMRELFEAAGFGDVEFHWYHYHAAPPLLESALGRRFREESLALEHERSGWRGYFLCSAYVVEAVAT